MTDAPAPPGAPNARPPADGEQKPPFYRRTFFWVLVGMLVGLLLLLLLFYFYRPFVDLAEPAQDPDSELAALLDLQDAHNKGLEEEIRRLHALLEEDPCTLRGILGVSPENNPVGPTYERPLAPADNGTQGAQGMAPRETRPAPAANATVPPPVGSPPPAPAPAPATVGELMDQATVFVLSSFDDKIGMGSGFFVAPGVIATNSHVVQGPTASILVGNKVLGGMQPARVIAYSPDTSRDFALLSIDRSLAGKAPILQITTGANRTDRVSAWGFPGYIAEIDPKLASLARGDIKAVPEVVYSEGVVSVVLDRKPPVILHTAAISQGNSGGPLINDQGVVVGINTFIKIADQSYSQTNIALPGADLVRFMKENGVTAAVPAK